VLADPLLGRQQLDELAQLLGHEVPGHPDVSVQRQGFVLGGDENAPEPGVDAVAEREVDDPVGTAEIHGRFGALRRQRVQAFTRTSGEQDYEDVVSAMSEARS
jgi:hypothetical protein